MPARPSARIGLLGKIGSGRRRSSDAIISYAMDATNLTWNPAAERVFGYAAAEVVGQSMARLVPPEQAHEPEALIARLPSGVLACASRSLRRSSRSAPSPLSRSCSRHSSALVRYSTLSHRLREYRKKASGTSAASTIPSASCSARVRPIVQSSARTAPAATPTVTA